MPDPETELYMKTHRTVRHPSLVLLAFSSLELPFVLFCFQGGNLLSLKSFTLTVVEKVVALLNDSYKKTTGSSDKAQASTFIKLTLQGNAK